MKNIFKTIAVLLIFVFLTGCHKITTEGVTEITYYPQFEMTGGKCVFHPINTTFTEPGIKAFEGEKELTVSIKGTVDTSVKGLYFITYSAKNSDGFSASVQRVVAVITAPKPSVDLSGEYVNVANTAKNSVITKIDDILGYYHATDSWRQSRLIPLDFVDMGDGSIQIIPGSSPYGHFVGIGGEIIPPNRIRFNCMIDQGINEGVKWNETYQLK